MTLTVISLFSGVGGIDLGLERAGMNIVGQVEIAPYCQAVLARHFPAAQRWLDVRTVHGIGICGGHCTRCLPTIDVMAGGFPCPPVSHAGKRLGADDPRWLWPDFNRLIGEIRPRYVFIENVPGLRTLGLRGVLADLTDLGYDTEWQIVPAEAFGAPHVRQRIVIVAVHALPDPLRTRREHDQEGHKGCGFESVGTGTIRAVGSGGGKSRHPASSMVNTGRAGRQEQRGTGPILTPLGDAERPSRRRSEPNMGGASHGLSGGLDRAAPVGCSVVDDLNVWHDGWEDGISRTSAGTPHRVDRLTALGNAVVPQLAEWVGRCILAADAAIEAAA